MNVYEILIISSISLIDDMKLQSNSETDKLFRFVFSLAYINLL